MHSAAVGLGEQGSADTRNGRLQGHYEHGSLRLVGFGDADQLQVACREVNNQLAAFEHGPRPVAGLKKGRRDERDGTDANGEIKRECPDHGSRKEVTGREFRTGTGTAT